MARNKKRYDTEKLQARRYDFNKTPNVQRLQQLVSRATRGLISYEKRTVAELQQFCKQRKLHVPKKTTKKDVIGLLEHADENARFESFSDLAAELRVRVYEILFEDQNRPDSGSPKRPPGQPAIAKTSHLLRQEALPVFYDTVRVTISFRDYHTSLALLGMWDHGLGGPEKINFPNSVPDSTISQYKRILVDGLTCLVAHDLVEHRWEIDLPTKGKEAEVRCIHPPSSKTHPANARIFKRAAESIIQQTLKKMAAREGGIEVAQDRLREIPRGHPGSCRPPPSGGTLG